MKEWMKNFVAASSLEVSNAPAAVHANIGEFVRADPNAIVPNVIHEISVESVFVPNVEPHVETLVETTSDVNMELSARNPNPIVDTSELDLQIHQSTLGSEPSTGCKKSVIENVHELLSIWS
ncbi:uncharacterized protein LOC130735591 [Lotus japonicus]|uniref:Uncharacterized protein n=1 Tax=Lotus japonicus TaxID=34305 RepID=I3T7K9_LOTJA|nr:uncharacterized protein LOC130735591 [Lotus japonicus]AFK48501.1 unknown [Lotus japonicus]